MPRRNTQETLIAMKKTILNDCLVGKMTCRKGAELLALHPKSFSRLKRRYVTEGENALTPKPSGPKKGLAARNRTPEWLEKLVCVLASQNRSAGPVELADRLKDTHGVKLNQATVYRILKRCHARYNRFYQQAKREKPQLYCLERPGEELQLDACYPFGRGRQLVCFDAIDDCSRYVLAKMYDRETSGNAIDFIKHLLNRAPFPVKRIRIDNRNKNQITAFCQSIGLEVIVNDAYEPKQNGKIERFHRTVKNRFFWSYCGFYDHPSLIDYRLRQWLVYYNEQRRHGGYGMNRLTPVQKIAASLFNSLNIIPLERVTLTMQSYKF